jgi:hypothetical protein
MLERGSGRLVCWTWPARVCGSVRENERLDDQTAAMLEVGPGRPRAVLRSHRTRPETPVSSWGRRFSSP